MNVLLVMLVLAAPAAAPGVSAPAAANPATSAAPAPRPKRVRIKPYVPPRLDPEPALVAADVTTVEVPASSELAIVARPAAFKPMVGAAAGGARLQVRGMFTADSAKGCANRKWYALQPFGWVCSTWVRPTQKPPSTDPVLRVAEGQVLPFQYVMIGGKDGAKVPMWASVQDLKNGEEPILQLKKGDTVAAHHLVNIAGTSYWVAEDDRVVPSKHAYRMGHPSQWAGLALDEKIPLPFVWVTPEQAKVYDLPGGKVVANAARRERFPVLEERGSGSSRWLRVGEGRWMKAGELNEVRMQAKPSGATENERWIDVDLGEQVLVAYEGAKPVYATLVSSGRSMPTPRGNYPIWAKVSHITMKSQPYEDKTYYVDRVPWSLFFQAHNAIHGAYWHDRFGVSKSHGCINLSPRDARWLFEWLPPALPPGWSGSRTPNLLEGVTVHIYNSRSKQPFKQERPIGPPDREEEKAKKDEADVRRLQEAAAAAGLPAGGIAPGASAPAPARLPTADPR